MMVGSDGDNLVERWGYFLQPEFPDRRAADAQRSNKWQGIAVYLGRTVYISKEAGQKRRDGEEEE
jgi:hypothetical protein